MTANSPHPCASANAAPGLFDVLLRQGGLTDAQWHQGRHALALATVPSVRTLAAALALGESRLTGADNVLACVTTNGITQQAHVRVPHAEVDRHAWLADVTKLFADRSDDAGDHAWCATSEAPCASTFAHSQWQWIDGELRFTYQLPFDEASAALFAGCVARALTQLTEGDGPLAQVDVIDPVEREHLLHTWNDTAVPRRAQDTVHGLFAATARRHPERIAIEADGAAVRYDALALRSDCIAAGLMAAGVVPGDIVALMLERSPDAIAAMLGILKAGAAFLPLDASHPAERLAFTLNDAQARLIIATPGGAALPGVTAPLRTLNELEADAPPPALPTVEGDALAYVMYTSGSTGTPKGAQIMHRAIIRLVVDVDYIHVGDAPRMLHAAPLGFDASTLEVWAPLLNGGTCIVHGERIPTGCGLARTIQRHQARIAWLTAALFNAIVDDDASRLEGLRQLLIGGEALSVAHVRKAYAALPDVTIINGYGPTECTTFSATYPIPRDLDAQARSIPIGRPIPNTTLHVLNAGGRHVPVGVAGELYIGGAGLARDYLGQPQLTAERFVPDSFAAPGERLYRTGDLVRWLPEGVVEFIGRTDHQVKIRGFRIELGEIEAALQRIAGVRAGAVLAREDRPGQKRLVAYYVADDAALSARRMREQLAQALPEFMVPAIYLRLDSLPVTTNGKLDRRALPAPDSRRPELAEAYVAPQDTIEQKLCDIYADMLGLDQVGRLDNFFDLGGHSLLAVRTLARIHADVSSVPSIAAFFAQPTPAALAALARHDGATSALATRLARGRHDDHGEPIAIIAMAGRFPGAADVEAFWTNLCEGRESITFFTPEQLDLAVPASERGDAAYVAARGIVDGVEEFDASFFGMSPREAELTDPQQRIFLELCWECLERGGYVPDAHEAPVGVFGGMHNATYFQRQLSTRPDLIDKLGAFQVMLANEKDYLTTRVAHKLNLTGPAISMNTACSTSLVAICQATAALRAGQCEMALAGGASITCPPRSGYLSQEGSMLSPDGHTRTFDAQAQGTVFSDGAAVILLKRLSDAERDGDTIYAIIRGVAVNNDGGHKASFTAPSSAGQAAVISMALADAGVDARSISYVEAHGTATPLGDPIEIEGLTAAYRRYTNERAFCAIGSVKSNMGHLVMAAGATSVIKTALSLHERVLPPSLHYQSANPKLALDDTPFVVNAELRTWTGGDEPLRAGVSSFGVGGTNAHVILEQAPPAVASEPADGPQLLLLSARSADAVASAATRLAAHLRAHPESNLADVAHTLIQGRKRFAQRLAVAAQDTADAVTRLTALAANQARSAQAAPGVVFLFPGQGSQYAGMGRALHAAEPVFRQALDACAEALHAELGSDLRERLFADDADALRETSLTQPATFAIEYALAQWWLSLGLRPVAMIGHSVGEFVAAVLAGVMTLADGARLVARRGRLMQALPAGAMLSVRQDASALITRLPATLQLAAENSPQASVVSGEIAEVEAFRAALERDGVACRVLQTSHAFHSAMMDPALAPFGKEVASIALAAPQLPIISTLTGQRLTDAEATSPAYWTRHLRGTVRFSGALLDQLAQADTVFLEVGPRTALSTLARQHPQSRGRTIAASLADAPERERAALLDAVGQLWCAGATLDLAQLDRREHRHRLALPTYPFERKRYWIDAAAPASQASHAPAAPARDNVIPLFNPPTAPVAESPMEANLSGPSAGTARYNRLLSQLVELFEDVAGTELAGTDPGAGFVELGLDSLALTQVALQLQKTFSLKITFRELMESFSSFERLAMHIDQLLPPDAAAPATSAPATASATTVAMPSAAPTFAMPAVTGNAMQDVIQQQMLIMQQQLALLAAASSGAPVAIATPTPAPATPAAPSAPAAASAPASASAPAPDEEAALAHTTYDVKKAFGAIARIHSTTTDLSERQRARLDAFMRRYIDRTRASKEYTQRHRDHLADPRVVNGFRPLLKEMIYQIVVNRSKGSKVWDLDGNEYIDALNGFGMNLFGWQPDFVLDAVRRQLDAGYEIGPQHPLAGEVAEQVCELTGFDRAALCNTGSEAVMGTIRIARTVTGRDTLVIFTGSYHGIFDEVIVRGTKKLRSVPAAPGILRNTSEHVLVLDYGTPESLQIIRERAASIAAVLVEPVQSRRPDFQPRDFLKELRAITADAGALLIFDEVVTGFRSHPRGAQAMLGIDADLASYGKVVGGGFPIGVIAGKRRYMDALDGGGWQYGDASIPTVGVTYFAGTFVRHPLALAAAHAVLTHLKANGQALQERLNTRTALLMDELNAFCASVGAPIQLVHFASVWKTNFTEDHPLQDLLFAMMRSRGIHVLDNFPCFFTTAHSEQDFLAIAKAFKESVLELQEAEFLPRNKNVETLAFDATRPPVHGARLGKDHEGNPAWFVPNPDMPGKFMRVNA